MIPVSDAWKEAHRGFLLPETFVEIICEVVDTEAQAAAHATVDSDDEEAVFSRCDNVTVESTATPKYATLERNLWVLDGTHSILPGDGSSENPGYASPQNIGNLQVHTETTGLTTIPGITITWSSEYGEYPTRFTVQAWLNEMPVGETVYIEDNSSNVSVVDLELSEYDRIHIRVEEWCLPDHRARIDNVALGYAMTFGKKDIISYTHEQSGDLNSGTLPKNAITFSLDNSDGKWDPINPTGLAKYLCERQKITTRYGMDVNGTVEWIPGGVFYLSEWRAPANGLEASFVARDIFEYLIDAGGIGAAVYNTLSGLVNYAVRAYLPDGARVVTDSVLENYYAAYVGKTSHAESIQKCANAAGCILRYDRDGALHIEPLKKEYADYTITAEQSYTYPEVELSKPLKSVAVLYKDSEDNPYVLPVSSVGEQQTVDNDYITSQEQAAYVAGFVRDALEPRSTVSGEFRADPRLDLYDIVTVEGKYGDISPVAITNITYRYTGCFRATYEGRVITVAEATNTLGAFVLNVSTLGQEE